MDSVSLGSQTPDKLRSTQRAPKSCLDCSRRKVRCDKRIPCNVCIRRGKALTCARERVTVNVKNKRTTEQLLSTERRSLRLYDKASRDQPPTSPDETISPAQGWMSTPSLPSPDQYLGDHFISRDPYYKTDGFEQHLFEVVGNAKTKNTVVTEFDVEFPSRYLSELLLQQGENTAWAHAAIHYPTFVSQHSTFWNSCSNARERALYDPFWLAVYFSFLSAVLVFNDDTDGLDNADFMGSDSITRLRKWYDAAIFYLYKADFLRNPDVRTVQATAILAVVFKNVGDYTMYQVAIPIAVRTAQILQLDQESELQKLDIVEREVCRRAWWTIVICEWLPVPYHPPCINEKDFEVHLPSAKNDDEIGAGQDVAEYPPDYPRSIHYHIAMIKSAILYHRFRSKLKDRSLGENGVVDLVVKTDEELAYIIGNLPSYLCADAGSSWSLDLDYERFPWIPVQRIKLSLFLLNLRITINKTLQNIWSEHGSVFRRTRSICLRSAEAMIALAVGDNVLLKWPNTWAAVAHLFSAAMTLAIELEVMGEASNKDHYRAVNKCRDLIRSIQHRNRVAAAALQILDTIVVGPQANV